jgi:hypothetical protein
MTNGVTKISVFFFRDERDYPSIITNANEWIMKLLCFHPFRFEMNGTNLLSLLARMNEENTTRFHPFRFEMDATILLSLLTRMITERSYNGSILFVSNWTILFCVHYNDNHWRRSFKISRFSFRDERDYPSINTNANEWRSKLQRLTIFVSRWRQRSFYHY